MFTPTYRANQPPSWGFSRSDSQRDYSSWACCLFTSGEGWGGSQEYAAACNTGCMQICCNCSQPRGGARLFRSAKVLEGNLLGKGFPNAAFLKGVPTTGVTPYLRSVRKPRNSGGGGDISSLTLREGLLATGQQHWKTALSSTCTPSW